jgi:hypothetical protein
MAWRHFPFAARNPMLEGTEFIGRTAPVLCREGGAPGRGHFDIEIDYVAAP